MSTTTFLSASALSLVLLLAACNGDESGASAGPEEEKLKVVTSLGIFADFAREIGGDPVEVTAVIPAGADPETFEPTPQDIRVLSEADLVFINGQGLESAFENVIENNVPDDTPVLRFSELFGEGNPHFWLSLDNALAYVEHISNALAEADAGNAELYEANLKAYKAELDALGRELKAAVTSIPLERRKLVTTHDAFPHFADYLGLELVGFVTPTEAQEPSPRDIQQLVAAIRDEKVPAVFSEPGFSDKILKQVASEAGVQICVLYSDSLDERVQTYVEMMRFNAEELARCLGGTAGG